MKRKIKLTLFFILGFMLYAGAQDVIYFKNGSKEDSKIVLVGPKEIQYKKFNNQDGPVYSIAKSEVVMITYQNGEYEMFSSHTDVAKQTKEELKTNFARNMLGYNLFDVIYGDFTISYERILSSGTVGIKISDGFGYAYNSDYWGNNENWVKSAFYSGLGVNFYPTGQGKWRFFLGPQVRIGYGKQSYWSTIWDEYGNYIGEEEVEAEGIYTKFIIDNGVMFTPVRSMSISAVAGFGVRYFPESNHSDVMPTGYFSINLNYRFSRQK